MANITCKIPSVKEFLWPLLHANLRPLVEVFVDYKNLVRMFEAFSLKPTLHIVVRIAENACDNASKRILKLSAYRLKIFLVKYQNM